MKTLHRGMAMMLILFCLVSCKIDLYSGLSEHEANQMLALLMLHRIEAEKQSEKGVTVKLRVEQKAFINAVELLRQKGFPRQKYATVDKIFPANQLVTSPLQELAKITYLKEQQLESMLSTMDGVIDAKITIAVTGPANGKNGVPTAAAAFIKFSPEVNLENYRPQIKSLIHNAIPGLEYSDISVLMQPVNYRFIVKKEQQEEKKVFRWDISWLINYTQELKLALIALGIILSFSCIIIFIKRLRR